MPTVNISVIISTFKRSTVLEKTLSSFCALQTDDLIWELILIDNGNDTATKAVVEKFTKKLPIVFLEEPTPGKNKALNKALPEASGDLFVFSDDDVIADPAWLKALWSAAEKWPDFDVFGGKIIPVWPDFVPPWGENHPINKNLFAQHSPWPEDTPYGPDDPLAVGPNMTIRRKIFDQGYQFNDTVGPNGSTIYRMGSEMELLLRLRSDGIKQIYIPSAVVGHQIRPDQISTQWIRRRGFRVGYCDFSETSNEEGKTLLGINLYLWKRLIAYAAGYNYHRLSGNRFDTYQNYMDLYKTKGKMYSQNIIRSNGTEGLLAKILKSDL